MRYFTWKIELVSNALWMIASENLFLCQLAREPFKLNFFDKFGSSKAFYTGLT